MLETHIEEYSDEMICLELVKHSRKKYTDTYRYIGYTGTHIGTYTCINRWSKISKMLISVEDGSSLYYSILFMFEKFYNKKGRKKERERGREGEKKVDLSQISKTREGELYNLQRPWNSKFCLIPGVSRSLVSER